MFVARNLQNPFQPRRGGTCHSTGWNETAFVQAVNPKLCASGKNILTRKSQIANRKFIRSLDHKQAH